MSTVEAAASLFGPSDSGSEFFTAPESADSASHSPVGDSKNNELFSDQDTSNLFPVSSSEAEASSLFSNDAGGQDIAGTVDDTQSQSLPWDAQSSQDTQAVTDENAQNGYYGEEYYNGYNNGNEPQWQSHLDQQTVDKTITDYYDSYVPPNDQYGHAPNESSHSSYVYEQSNSYTAPANTNGTQYGYGSVYAAPPASQQPNYDYSTTNSSTSIYDPYNPSNQTSQPTHSMSAPTTSINGAYDPYNPSTSQRNLHPTTASSAFTPSSTYPSDLSSVSAPSSTAEASKPPAPPFRPAKYDAYDPPLPASKPKRSSTTHAYHQPPVSQYSTPPPPRPPPLRASTFVSEAANGPSSPPPPPSRSAVVPPQKTLLSAPQHTVTLGNAQTFKYDAVQGQYMPQLSHGLDSQYIPPTHSDAHGLPPSPNMNVYSPDYSKGDHPYVPSSSPTAGLSQPSAYAPHIDEDAIDNDLSLRSGAQVTNDFGHETTRLPPVRHTNDDSRAQSPHRERLVHKEDASSRPGSPMHMSTSPPRRSLDSSPIQRPPDRQKDVSPIQRGFSPVSESGRSWTGSQSRSSRPSSRQGPLSATQTFSSLDEQVAKHSEPYSFVPRNISRVNSPDRNSPIVATTAPSSTVANAYLSYQDQNVVDLASDTSSVNGRSSPALSNSQHQDHSMNTPAFSSVYDPYKPQQMEARRTLSPVPFTQQQQHDVHPAPPQLTHRQNSYDPPIARERSMSNISAGSAISSRSRDLYAPRITGQHDVYGIESVHGPQATLGRTTYPQHVTTGRTSLEKPYSPPPVTGPYAPSPSLLGTNDPLGRTGVKIPVISFGFGGKLVSCFHSPPTLDTGFDVALSSRNCTDIYIRPLHKVMPESTMEMSAAEYPGPLFGDPGSPVNALVRTTTTSSAKSKSKKAKVLTYLDERAEELQRAIGYLSAGTIERRRADGKFVLVRLLHVLVEFDGQIHGSPEVESAVQVALVPHLAASDSSNSMLSLAPTGAALASGSFGSATTNERPIAEYAVRPSALNMIQEFLYRGEKRKAYHYALDEKLWAHAMVIAGSIDKEAFKEVVNEFVRAELGTKTGPAQFSGRPQPLVMNGYESLRLAYSLYSGQSSSAVQNLLSTGPSLMNGTTITLQPPTPMSHLTPLTPNFPSPDLAVNVLPESLNKWQEYAAMLYSGQMGTESSAALTTLGDYLRKNGWIEAAHCCYLLSPQSSPIGGVGTPAVRIVLVGSQSPQDDPTCCRDPDGFIFSEIVEFALGLHEPPKGQEAFTGFPHLQAYRLIHAIHLAEKGNVALAKRYCDAINAASSKPSPYLTLLLADKLKEFSNQIIGDPELDRSKAWIGGKIAKPSLDGLGDWIGGTLSRFVAGEAETSQQAEDVASNNPVYAGAFSQYSNISSTNTSKSPSPAPSFVNGGTMTQGLPNSSGSAAGLRNLASAFNPVNRASSAWDYSRPESRKNTPPPRVASAAATTTTFAQSHSFSQAMDSYSSGFSNMENTNGSHLDQPEGQQSGGWWEQTSTYGSTAATPTATSFIKAEGPMTPSADGFISLMDSVPSFAPSTMSSYTATSGRQLAEDNLDDDDLGLGNSSSKRKQQTSENDKEPAEKTEKSKEEPKKPETKPQANGSGSWFGRLFSRSSSSSSSSPGPVKANLGEDNGFYFDKELGKWVNKKAGAEPPKPAAPPPPPSRAQTASPSKVFSHAPPPPSPLPPRRPASAMEPTMAPPKRSVTTPRIQSNLIPEDAASAPPTPAIISSMSATPPTGRSRSAATKRNVRSRYVDVIQAQQHS